MPTAPAGRYHRKEVNESRESTRIRTDKNRQDAKNAKAADEWTESVPYREFLGVLGVLGVLAVDPVDPSVAIRFNSQDSLAVLSACPRTRAMTATKNFQAVPDADELARLGRDLRFHPANAESAMTLTSEQVEGYNRDGYARPFRVYSDEEIADVRGYFDGLLARYVAEGKDSYSISSAHLRHGRVWDMLTNPRIVALVKDILGENVVGWGSHFFCKMPGDGKAVAWHQDASYWPLSPSKAVTVWLAIDDADPENANMRFIAGSHHVGHLTFRPSDPAEHNVLNQTIENAEQYGAVVDDPLKAGECSLHSDLLLHGSEANRSARRRCGLTLRYAAADVRAGMEWNEKGVIVSGSDPSRHWSNRPRPSSE